ncbi:MAG: glycosyltransferase family 2 protein [Patescibacteria group bacterium]|nr:glycosyltransferase family 2 protein [Patescibacteria group bacterium]
MMLSAIVLTKNEEAVIEDCLNSVKWADEIVIVDNGSTDNTLKLAKNFNPKIVHSPPENSFADHRNLGAKAANGDWLLYVDADERVTPELKEEIFSLIANCLPCKGELLIAQPVAYAIPRKNIRLTKVLYHGGWWPDYVLRLMKKESLEEWQGELHEQPVIKGKTGYLKEAFIHFSHRGSFEHKLQNTIKWSKIEAEKMLLANHPPMTITRFLSAMAREFYKRMIKYQAFRDGTEGVIEAFYQVFSVFITYARLWEMQNSKEKISCSK